MKKYIPRIILTLLAAVIVLLPLLPKTEADAEYTYGGKIDFRESYIDGVARLYLYDSSGIIAELPTNSRDGYYLDFSLEGSSALAIPDMDYDVGGTLYHISSEKTTLIAEGVYHAIAADGDRGAYITDLRDGWSRGQLHYYNGSKSVCIEPQLYTRLNCGDVLKPAISPDGKTVAYCRDDGNGGIVGMLYHKGKYIELGSDIFPIAVSNDMEYLYYGKLSVPAENIAHDDSLPLSSYYVRSDKGDVLLGEGTFTYFRFNRDFSEAIVTASDFSVISADGGSELQHFSDFYPVGVIAPQAGLAAELSFGYSPLYQKEYIRLGIDSFKDKVLHGDWGGFAHDVCMGGGCIYHNTAYLDSQLQLHILTDRTYFMHTAEEGHAALYKLDGELYYIPDVRDYTPGEELRISQYCKLFTGNADFSTIYYTNTGNNLYSYSGGTRTILAQDVYLLTPSENSGTLRYNPGIPSARFNGSIYFRKNADGSLWRISPEGAIEQLSSIPNGAGLRALGNELLFTVATDEGTDFYRLDGDAAVKVISGMKKYR